MPRYTKTERRFLRDLSQNPRYGVPIKEACDLNDYGQIADMLSRYLWSENESSAGSIHHRYHFDPSKLWDKVNDTTSRDLIELIKAVTRDEAKP